MKRIKNGKVPDIAYFMVLEYKDTFPQRFKNLFRICELNINEFVQIYDKAVSYYRNQIVKPERNPNGN